MVKRNIPIKSPKISTSNMPNIGWYSPAVWCKTLGISRSTVSRWIRLGLLKHSRVRKRVMIHESAISEMFKRYEKPAWKSEIKKQIGGGKI